MNSITGMSGSKRVVLFCDYPLASVPLLFAGKHTSVHTDHFSGMDNGSIFIHVYFKNLIDSYLTFRHILHPLLESLYTIKYRS